MNLHPAIIVVGTVVIANNPYSSPSKHRSSIIRFSDPYEIQKEAARYCSNNYLPQASKGLERDTRLESRGMMTRLTYGKSTWRKNSPVWKQISIYCRMNSTDIFHFSFSPRTLRDWDFPRSRNRWFILSYPVFPCLKVCEMSLGHHQFNNIDVISSKYRCFIDVQIALLFSHFEM